MLGVQNNNRNEIHYRINIKNCSKMTIKTLFFPSMKHIIFEVIYILLLKKNCPLQYDHDVIAHLIETINLYGMSVDKFKRIMKCILTEFFYKNDLYALHLVELKLYKRENID